MGRLDKLMLSFAALVLVVVMAGIAMMLRSDVRTCRRYFPEVPVLDCAFSSRYQVLHKVAP